MKVSLNWIKEFTDVDLPIDELVEKIGNQLGAVEQVTDLGKRYQGIIVAKVIDCQPHPDADKLHICKIDDGNKLKDIERDDKGYIQVVCGATNARKDLLVVFVPPGTLVPDTIDHDPLTIEIREIRGVKSNGMLASYRELAISNDHEGIVELDPNDAKPGDGFADVFKLNDHIITIENKMFTHRPDCFGQLGIAREISGICRQSFTSPDWYKQSAPLPIESNEELPLRVENNLPELVPRFMAVVLSVKENGPSPIWLQTYLSRVGVRPVNTIVDITNYMMCVTGQPQHAYDYDKLKQQDGDNADTACLIVRSPNDGETITALNGKQYSPRPEAIGIASATKLVGIGGVIGGADTEVDSTTKRIVLECASFDMNSIRRTAMENGISTDAVTCYSKGQSPLQNNRVLNETINMLGRLLGVKLSSKIIDLISPNLPIEADTMHPPLTDSTEEINRQLGLDLDKNSMKNLLQNVEFKITDMDSNNFQLTAPFWRTDIEITEDVTEEVGRLWGYDKLNISLPKRNLNPPNKDPLLDMKANLRKLLSAAGANELLTYSFIHGNLMKKVGQDPAKAFQIKNALSPDLQYYRLSLLPSLLDKIYPNIRSGSKDFVIFEINPAHNKEAIDGETKLPIEYQRLGLVVTADNKFAEQHYHGAAYFQSKKFLQYLFNALGIKATFEAVSPETTDLAEFKNDLVLYDANRTAVIHASDGKILGLIGELNANVKDNLKLPNFVAGFEINIAQLGALQAPQAAYHQLSRFPSIQQDICLRVPSTVAYAELYAVIAAAMEQNQDLSLWHKIDSVDIYQPKDDDKVKQVTFHITIGSYQRTLTDKLAESVISDIVKAAGDNCGAIQI